MSVVKNKLTLESHEKEQKFVNANTIPYGRYVITPNNIVGYRLGMSIKDENVDIIVWFGQFNSWDYACEIKVKELTGHHTIKLEVVAE